MTQDECYQRWNWKGKNINDTAVSSHASFDMGHDNFAWGMEKQGHRNITSMADLPAPARNPLEALASLHTCCKALLKLGGLCGSMIAMYSHSDTTRTWCTSSFHASILSSRRFSSCGVSMFMLITVMWWKNGVLDWCTLMYTCKWSNVGSWMVRQGEG